MSDNTRDALTKGRFPQITSARRRSTFKLTETQVREIRDRAAQGDNSTVLGKAYGIDSSNVRQIVRRVIWRHA